jgi:hypothetical protein
MNAFVAERFRHGRTLLTGDAAHALPIVGGPGMNTGIADVYNLCWKRAGVLRGWAEPEPAGDLHTDDCGLGPHGALLVRPDGHIGARWRDPSVSHGWGSLWAGGGAGQAYS